MRRFYQYWLAKASSYRASHPRTSVDIEGAMLAERSSALTRSRYSFQDYHALVYASVLMAIHLREQPIHYSHLSQALYRSLKSGTYRCHSCRVEALLVVLVYHSSGRSLRSHVTISRPSSISRDKTLASDITGGTYNDLRSWPKRFHIQILTRRITKQWRKKGEGRQWRRGP